MGSCRDQVVDAIRSPLQTWLRVTEKAEGAVSRQLARLAKRCAIHPRKTLCLTLLLTLACGVGIVRFDLQTDGDKLWRDQDSDPVKYQEYVEDHFDATSRRTRMLLTAKDGGSVLRMDVFEEAFQIAAEVATLEGNPGQNFQSLCAKRPSGECRGIGALRFFNSSLDVFRQMVKSDADVQLAVNSPSYPDDGSMVILSSALGGVSRDADGNIETASTLRLQWDIDGDKNKDDAKEWEESYQDAFLDKTEWTVKQRFNLVTVFIQAERSLDDELGRTVGGDIPLFVMAFFIMVSFCSLLLGKTCSWTQSRRLLGFLDFMLVMQGMLTGYGLAMLLGTKFTLLQQTLPFILVGIGVDDAFVITSAFDATDQSLPIPDRIEEAMSRVGMSITLTTMTDMAAFILGTTSAFPAVQYFCIYAAVSCFFIWLLHCTSYCALLASDTARASKNKLDPITCMSARSCCMPPPGATQGPAPGTKTPLAQFLGRATRILVSHPLVMMTTVLAFVSIAGISAWSVTQGLGTEFKLLDITPDTSFVRDFMNEEERHFGTSGEGLATPTAFYVRGIDLSSIDVQRSIEEAGGELLDLRSVDESLGLTSWHTAFSLWAWQSRGTISELPDSAFVEVPGGASRAGCEAGLPPGVTECATHFMTGAAFAPAVAYFVSLPEFQRFDDDVVFGGDGSIVASRLRANHNNAVNAEGKVDILDDTDDFTDRWNGRLPGCFVNSPWYGFWDTNRIIIQQMATSILFCLLAVTLISAFVLAHPLAVLIVLVTLALIFMDLMGNILLWGLHLNSISMINLIMAVGLVVDYSMHVAHSFGIQDPKLPRRERAVLAMEEIGPAVFLGVSATFVAIMPLAFASSEIFRVFFKMFFGIAVVGGLHGLVMMPVCLALCGPSIADLALDAPKQEPSPAHAPRAADVEDASNAGGVALEDDEAKHPDEGKARGDIIPVAPSTGPAHDEACTAA